MHVQIATKILSEISRRELNNLQDWEDEIMTNLDFFAGQQRTDLIRFLGGETASSLADQFNDKLRVLSIIILCTNDSNLVSNSIRTVLESSPD